MSDSSQNREDSFLLTFPDLVRIAKKNKRKLAISSIVFSFFAVCYGLVQPIQYEAEGTFKDKGKSQPGLSNSVSATFLLLGSSANDSDALTMMRSKKLIEELIETQGLQLIIDKNEHRFPFLPLQTIKNNLLAEYALFRNKRAPVVKDQIADLKAQQVSYLGETPIGLQLTVKSAEEFVISDDRGRPVGEGVFGAPFSTNAFSFLLTAQGHLTGNSYNLLLLPLKSTAEIVTRQFTIELDRTDKNLLRISHRYPDRRQAADNLNTLMQLYQKHIQKEHQRICAIQVDYLTSRQNEMSKELQRRMAEHAQKLSVDFSLTGFATSEKAMEFLANTQQQLRQKLFAIDLEIQRLSLAQENNCIDNMVFSSAFNLEIISRIATEKRKLIQQADSLHLALRNTPDRSKTFQESFIAQLSDLDEAKQGLKESALMITDLQNDMIPYPYPGLIDNPKFIIRTWYDRLMAAKENLNNRGMAKESVEDWHRCKSGFLSYLIHLNHYFNVYQKNIEDALAYQQAPASSEFKGINLEIAEELYIAYSKELNLIESKIAQQEFIIDRISEPSFEVSPLSSILADPVSVDLISKTSNLILSLKDHENRSVKEQERLKADLAIQKGFLKSHIQQSIKLLHLHHDFLIEKLRQLQSVKLSLLQEQISILENQLQEYLANALASLKKEQGLLEQNLVELRMEMGAFPQKWADEQLISQEMKLNKSLVEEIAKLVETKNISNNLEQFQSAPVDLAFPPIHPVSPRLLLLALIGAACGAFLSFAWSLGCSIAEGIKASAENLSAAGLHVAGTISREYKDSSDKDPLLDSDLSTLRRLIAFFTPVEPPGHHALLLLEGSGPDYSRALAELISKKGLTVLIVDIRFDDYCNIDKEGMLQYLEGKAVEPAVVKHAHYDFIRSGGTCRFANELLGSSRFKELLSSLALRYDWIIVSSSASPQSSEAENLLKLFPFAAISITEESVYQLNACIRQARNPDKRISFLFDTHS